MRTVSPAESAGMTAGVARKTARSTGFGCGSAARWGRPSVFVVCQADAGDEKRSPAPPGIVGILLDSDHWRLPGTPLAARSMTKVLS